MRPTVQRRFAVPRTYACSIKLLVAGCLLLCIAGGCEPRQSHDSTSELTKELKTLKSRIKELENGREQSSNPGASSKTEVDTAKAEGHYADATHAVAAGHNVLLYFATRNYASGDPSAATSQLGAYMNYYTAKRLQAALAVSMQRHAAVFGEVPADKAAGQPTATDKSPTIYVNFVRLTGSPEELVIDLGLNPKPVGTPTAPIPISHTVIMDYYTTSTFYRQVSGLIAEYESKHGTIETDIQKRITN